MTLESGICFLLLSLFLGLFRLLERGASDASSSMVLSFASRAAILADVLEEYARDNECENFQKVIIIIIVLPHAHIHMIVYTHDTVLMRYQSVQL